MELRFQILQPFLKPNDLQPNFINCCLKIPEFTPHQLRYGPFVRVVFGFHQNKSAMMRVHHKYIDWPKSPSLRNLDFVQKLEKL